MATVTHGARPREGGEGAAGVHNVATTLNYYNDPGDGSPPAPVVIGGFVVLSLHGGLGLR